MRRFVFVAVALALAVSAVPAATAFAANATDYEGTYLGSVRTSAGNDLGAWVQVKDLGGGRLKLVVKAGGSPTIPLVAKMQWNGPDSFTITASLYIPGWEKPLVDGSGTATFVKSGDGWSVSGAGSGEAMGTAGSAAGAGKKISDDFITPVLSSNTAAAAVGAPAGPVDKVIVSIGVAEKQPEISDAEKVAAGALSAVAVIAALILCMAIGATMSGSEFAELMLTE